MIKQGVPFIIGTALALFAIFVYQTATKPPVTLVISGLQGALPILGY